jgi:hypothetical protein
MDTGRYRKNISFLMRRQATHGAAGKFDPAQLLIAPFHSSCIAGSLALLGHQTSYFPEHQGRLAMYGFLTRKEESQHRAGKCLMLRNSIDKCRWESALQREGVCLTKEEERNLALKRARLGET